MKKQILITIGREYGSGGHDLAALLSQRLGIRMLDRELIDELWKNDPEMQQLAQQYDERPANRILSRKINEFDNSIPHNVAQRQFDMIRQIADSGESAIFVGRCADYILRDHPRTVNIFIAAGRAERIERLCRLHGIAPGEAESLMDRTDARRAAYYNYYSSGTWGMAETYDLCIDSSVLGIDGTTGFVLEFVERKLGVKP